MHGTSLQIFPGGFHYFARSNIFFATLLLYFTGGILEGNFITFYYFEGNLSTIPTNLFPSTFSNFRTTTTIAQQRPHQTTLQPLITVINDFKENFPAKKNTSRKHQITQRTYHTTPSNLENTGVSSLFHKIAMSLNPDTVSTRGKNCTFHAGDNFPDIFTTCDFLSQ